MSCEISGREKPLYSQRRHTTKRQKDDATKAKGEMKGPNTDMKASKTRKNKTNKRRAQRTESKTTNKAHGLESEMGAGGGRNRSALFTQVS